MIDLSRQEILTYIEETYCERMTYLVENCRIFDADALHSEFEVAEDNEVEWLFISHITDVC
jgi:hypothetical protein